LQRRGVSLDERDEHARNEATGTAGRNAPQQRRPGRLRGAGQRRRDRLPAHQFREQHEHECEHRAAHEAGAGSAISGREDRGAPVLGLQGEDAPGRGAADSRDAHRQRESKFVGHGP
jgi:hypothetical protein